MKNLIQAEIHRWLARRAIWVTLVGGIALCLLISVPLALSSKPPSDQEIAQVTMMFNEAHADWVTSHEQMYADCLSSVGQQNGPTQEDCVNMTAEPTLRSYLGDRPTFSEAVGAATAAGGILGAFMVLIAGATFWGAEYRNGTMATWLTFVPNRTRAWLAKSAVVGGAGALGVALTTAITITISTLTETAYGVAAQPLDLALQHAGRGIAFGALAALLGAALAVLFRQTLAPVLITLGYVLLQGLIGLVSLIPGGENVLTWLPEHNVAAFLDYGTKVTYFTSIVGADGINQETHTLAIPFEQGLIYVLAAVAVLAVWSWFDFRRRDIG